jgi:hypothetical protein
VSYYQGDYYQGDGIGKRFGRWFRKKVAPELRKAAPVLALVPGVGVVGAGAINAIARTKQPNQTTADTVLRVLTGPAAAAEVLETEARPRVTRSGAPRRVTATPRRRRTTRASATRRRRSRSQPARRRRTTRGRR